MKLRTIAVVGITLVAALIVVGIGGLAFLYSGVYDIAARRPHRGFVQDVLTTLQERSVAFHARDIEVPRLDEPDRIQRGLILYDEHCVICHGAPGESRERAGIGLNPNPPPLVEAAEKWTAAEIYWITANGLKMAGMPAFALGERPSEIWAITAFVVRMNGLSPAEYRRMLRAVGADAAVDDVEWVDGNAGWARLRAEGDPEAGAILIDRYGCGTCHVVPGVRGADGKVGPPLVRWADRHFIAGTLVNTPTNLVTWIVDPDAIEPGTAMPDVGVTPEEALDIAAYLYTLE